MKQPYSGQRALVSVTDKRGVATFARGLSELGFELVSTGGTRAALEAAGLTVTPVAAVTGAPEIMDGRVKTLHPAVFAGLLARPDHDGDAADLSQGGFGCFQVLVVNLYDFAGRTADAEVSTADAMEAVDIGGPSMLRAAAKNHAAVVPVVSPDDYDAVLAALRDGGDMTALRRGLAAKVFRHTSRYDAAIADFLESDVDSEQSTASPAPDAEVQLDLRCARPLRYGENPHQSAELWVPPGAPAGLAAATQRQGKPLSYNNLLDADAALRTAVDVGPGCVVFVKHNNPCGVAVRDDIATAVAAARAADPVSAFGAVVAVNGVVDAQAATALIDGFVEVLVARDVDEGATAVLSAKANLRVLVGGEALFDAASVPEWRSIAGALLRQSADAVAPAEVASARVVTERAPTERERRALRLAWQVAKTVRSNAIVFASEHTTLAVGAGQMSRIDAVDICARKALDALAGSAAASDAFFPFRDGLDAIAQAGATAVVQPGGSRRDQEVIDAANEHGMAMLFTGVRHFRH